MSLSIADEKAALRREMRGSRAKVQAAASPDLYEAAARQFEAHFPRAKCMAAYWPTGSEFDPRPLMEAAAALGAQLALPVIGSGGMTFHAWEIGGILTEGAHNIPAPGLDAPQVQPDIVVAPLIAMDRAGHRLGQGGGYYDRALAALRATGRPLKVVGIGFDEQLLAEIPHEPHDARLDYVLTPREFLATKG